MDGLWVLIFEFLNFSIMNFIEVIKETVFNFQDQSPSLPCSPGYEVYVYIHQKIWTGSVFIEDDLTLVDYC